MNAVAVTETDMAATTLPCSLRMPSIAFIYPHMTRIGNGMKTTTDILR
jgi:hypothetical protein